MDEEQSEWPNKLSILCSQLEGGQILQQKDWACGEFLCKKGGKTSISKVGSFSMSLFFLGYFKTICQRVIKVIK